MSNEINLDRMNIIWRKTGYYVVDDVGVIDGPLTTYNEAIDVMEKIKTRMRAAKLKFDVDNAFWLKFDKDGYVEEFPAPAGSGKCDGCTNCKCGEEKK